MPADTPAPADPTRPRVAALALLTLAGVAVCVLIAVPFLPALAWAVALAVMAYPLHRRLEAVIPYPGVAAGVTTTLVVAAVLVPVALVGGQLARETASAVTRAEVAVNSGRLDEMAETVPSGPWALDWVRNHVDVNDEARKLVGRLAGDAALFAQGTLGAALQGLVCVFVLYYALRDHRRLLAAVRDTLPMTRTESDYLFTRVDDTIHATVYATVVAALAQAVTGGLVFWWAGLPNVVVWATVMFVLGVLPVVGAVLVWLPAGVLLLMTDRVGPAAAVLGWGVLWSGPVGNWLYAYLAGGRMRLHAVPVLVAYVGGLAVFGVSGMVLGPVAVAVTLGLIDVWHRRLHPEERGELSPAAAPVPTARLATA
ncbi:AI-2E family transporter [Urbifossiella limnaea]|uniref:Putative inner membrane protein n=1 Tax=Urbifossiella limnaea TaxID=2528023 RepID=A0A517XL88_9BACT|nr:AI-2E family transporter [Urbifossiella limnaea]QDU18273.1 putative inner membrane protein [Urbifossiella limnaea]